MAHRYKRVHISQQVETEWDLFTGITSGVYFHPQVSREKFLEVVNDWNRLALLQSKVSGRIDYLYIAL